MKINLTRQQNYSIIVQWKVFTKAGDEIPLRQSIVAFTMFSPILSLQSPIMVISLCDRDSDPGMSTNNQLRAFDVIRSFSFTLFSGHLQILPNAEARLYFSSRKEERKGSGTRDQLNLINLKMPLAKDSYFIRHTSLFGRMAMWPYLTFYP